MIRRSLFLLILSYLCGVLISFRWGALAFSVDFFVLCGAIASGVFFVLSLIQSRTPKEEEDSTNNFAAVSLKGAYLTLMVTILMFGVQRDQERQQREVVAREAVQLVDDLVRRGDSVVWWLEGRLANYPDKIVGNRIRLVLHDIALIWQLPPGAGEPSLTLGTPTIRRANIPGRMQLTVLRDVWQQETGGTLPKPETVIEFSGRVVAPMTATTPGAFDEASFYRARNVTLLADVNLSHQITLQQIPTQQLPIQQILLAQIKMILWQWRAKGFELFERSIGGTDARATVQAMCLGHTQWRRPELRDAFFQTGTLHLFALSGLHAGMIALLVYYLARLAGMNLRQSAWITLVLLSLFVGVAGMRPSLIRATVMTFFLLAPRLLNTSSSPLYALAMSAALLLLLRPATVYDPGFYLSFGSVGGILFLYQSIYVSLLRGSGNTEDLLQSWVRRLVHRWVLQPVAVYWALMVGILPLLLLYYQHAPITGGLANLVAVPMASVTVAMGFLALLVNIVFPALAGLLADAAGSLAALLNAWIEWAAGWPLVGIDVAPAPLAAVILYYPLVFYRLLPLQRFPTPWGLGRFRIQFLIRSLAGVLLLLVAASIGPRDAQNQPRLWVLDVGQGDAILLQLGGGVNVLVDGGTREPSDKGKRVILPALKKLGIKQLDAVIVSHHDADHIGGLISVLQQIPVKQVIEPPHPPRETDIYREWSQVRYRAGERITAKAGMTFNMGMGQTLHILSPPATNDGLNLMEGNEGSLVVLIDVGATEVLLMGDAGEEAEFYLLQQGLLPDVEILKAGHHGSNSSGTKEFLKVTLPEEIAISAGKRNIYGHPHRDALQRYQATGAAVKLTAENGSLIYPLPR